MKLPPREPGVGSDKPDEFIELPTLGKYSIDRLLLSFSHIIERPTRQYCRETNRRTR